MRAGPEGTIGDQIARALKERGLSQLDVPRLSDGRIDQSTISRIVHGMRYPNLATLELLAEVLDWTFVIDPETTTLQG